jgi:hypothetical protein
VEPSGLLFLRCEATIGQKVETKLLSCPFCPSRCGAIYLFKKKKRKRRDAIWMDFAGMKLCGLLGKAFVLHGDRCSTGWE